VAAQKSHVLTTTQCDKTSERVRFHFALQLHKSLVHIAIFDERVVASPSMAAFDLQKSVWENNVLDEILPGAGGGGGAEG
jgi:hypothetical protein